MKLNTLNVFLPLNELPVADGAAVRLLSRVDLPVAVEGAGVGQLLAADLALHHGLPVGAHLDVAGFCEK